MSEAPLLAASAGYVVGSVLGRLLYLVLGLHLLVSGFKRRNDPSRSSRGTGRIVGGVVLVLLFLGSLGQLATGSTL